MGRRRKKTALPAPGAAFAVLLDDGRYGVCRVIRGTTDEEAARKGADCVLIAAAAWIGEAVPDADDPALRPILHLTHHAWDGRPELTWVSDPVPGEFIPIGTIEPTAEDKDIECLSYGGWASARIQPLAQWRWDHEREAVLAEDAEKNQKEAQRRQSEEKARGDYLANVTLEELRERTFFPHWKTSPSKKAIRGSREIMQETVAKLLELGPKAAEAARMAALKACIERFNEFDAELGYFIETIEREDICEEFEAIVHACGLGEHEDLADEWREW
jgi:hypothetical protein